MKLLESKIKILEIDINLDWGDGDYGVAAASIIDHPENVSKQRRISDAKLQILNDVAISTRSIILARNFEITKEQVSKKGYSYYIQFNVIDTEGNSVLPVGIIFRISNHRMQGDETPISSDTVIIRSFVLKGKHYDNSIAIIQTIANICQELQNGNIAILDQYTY